MSSCTKTNVPTTVYTATVPTIVFTIVFTTPVMLCIDYTTWRIFLEVNSGSQIRSHANYEL